LLDPKIDDYFCLLKEYLDVMRMLQIYDDDKVEEVFPEFENYNDQMLDYFQSLVQNKHLAEVAVGAKRQVLNLVRHSFFLKILMQD